MKKYVDENMMPVDYIVEQGILDGWNYEKWFSGKYTCTKIYIETLNYYTTVGPFYGYVTSLIDFPITFIEAPLVFYNARVSSGFAIPGGDVHKTISNFRCYSLSTYSKAGAQCIFEIEVIGKWK